MKNGTNSKGLLTHAPRKKRLHIGVGLAALLGVAIVQYLLRLDVIGVPEVYHSLVQRLISGMMGFIVILLMSSLINVFLIDRQHDASARYNLKRVDRLVVGAAIALIVLSIIFANWYPAVVSLGLISVIFGFALQNPTTSFIGWIYILIRQPYRVGDRIKINGATGDVMDIGYFDTTLTEFGGEYLSTDMPSGRVINFPNSLPLSMAVFNYTWTLFPFIWTELSVHVAYDSDLRYVSQTMEDVAIKHIGEPMRQRVKKYKDVLANTPIDDVDVSEEPVVFVRANGNTWLEMTVRFLVEPKHAAFHKTRILKDILATLNTSPDRVRFPKGDAR